MFIPGLVNMKLNRFLKSMLLTVFAVSLLSSLFGCGAKKPTGVNTKAPNSSADSTSQENANDKSAPSTPQNLVSSTDEYDKLSDEEKEKYEPPAKEIKIKNIVIKRGKTKFSKVVYRGDSKGVNITGRMQLTDVEDISNEDIFDFELSGPIQNNNRSIIIKSYDVDNRKKNRVRLGARVICLNYDEKNLVDCNDAVVDFYVQVKETKLTDQFKTAKVEKPKKPKPAPVPPVAEAPPKKDDTAVQPDQPAPTPPPAPPTVIQEDSHQIEGHDQSLDGAFTTGIDDDDEIEEILGEEKNVDAKVPPPPKKEKPKVIKDGLLVTSEGNVRPINQAVELPDGGHLLQATDLALQQKQLKEFGLYNIVHENRKKYYATFEMAQLISKLGQFTSQKFSKPFAVGNLSLPKGGESPPHASHQNGTDGDFGYLTDDDDVWFPSVARNGRLNQNAYNPVKTLELIEKAFNQTDIQIDRIFMDQLIIDDLCKVAKKEQFFNPSSSDPKWTQKNEFWKNVFRNIQHVDGHGDHMHIRIKCSPPLQRLCRPKIYRKVTHCQS